MPSNLISQLPERLLCSASRLSLLDLFFYSFLSFLGLHEVVLDEMRISPFHPIDRVHIIQPVMQELYFLRTLVSSNHSAGKKSLEDVRTVLDVPHDTYRETCVALGFLDDDTEWDLVTTDTEAYDMLIQIRASFVVMMVFNEVGHPVGLFDKH
jgi:hypothetical protein